MKEKYATELATLAELGFDYLPERRKICLLKKCDGNVPCHVFRRAPR